jgi:hypothetical protein
MEETLKEWSEAYSAGAASAEPGAGERRVNGGAGCAGELLNDERQ